MKAGDRIGNGRTASDAVALVFSVFVVFFAALLGVGCLVLLVSTPAILLNLSRDLTTFCGVGTRSS